MTRALFILLFLCGCAPGPIETIIVNKAADWWCASLTDSTKYCWIGGKKWALADTIHVDPETFYKEVW